MGDDLLAALDPVQLAERAGLRPDPWQLAALRSRAARSLWNVCRQGGKSCVAGVLACHQALYVPGSLTLLISPSERQSKELMAKVLQVYGATGQAVPADAESKLTLELSSGSRIIALPGSERTTRGFSAPSLVVIDEASRVDDELYYALTPMLATDPAARLLAISTPNAVFGWWYAAWTAGGALWERTRVTAHQCARISAAFLASERASMPAAVFAREYECVFSQITDAAFLAADVMAMLSDEVVPLFPAAAAGGSAGAPPAPADVGAYLS